MLLSLPFQVNSRIAPSMHDDWRTGSIFDRMPTTNKAGKAGRIVETPNLFRNDYHKCMEVSDSQINMGFSSERNIPTLN
jgi:hypothetical protein